MTHTCSEDSLYERASANLGRAKTQMEKGEYRRANILLRDGIETLGDHYFDEAALDDSGLTLGIARQHEWEGSFEAAANLRAGALSSRLDSYARVNNLTDCRTPEESAGDERAGERPPALKRR